MINLINLTNSTQIQKKHNNCLIFGLITFLLFTPACSYIKSSFRDYSEKPFNSEEWLSGDAIERNRMFTDIYEKQILEGKSRKSVRKLLGKPDLIQEVEDREIWLYHVEHSSRLQDKYFPVSFEDNGQTFAGRIKNGTLSLLVEK